MRPTARLASGLVRAAAVARVDALLAWRHRRRLPILMYHGVEPEPPRVPCWHLTSEAAFRAQLEHVARRWRVLPLEEALTRLVEGTLPARSAALTFDDGYLNNRTVAFPILERLGLPATVFVVTGLLGTGSTLWPDRLFLAFARARAPRVDLSALGLPVLALADEAARAAAYAAAVHRLKALPAAAKDAALDGLVAALDPTDPDDPGPFRLLGWDDVRALSATGLVRFGGHTTRHEILRHQSDDDVRREVRDSHERVEREVGRAPRVFAYPNGRACDFDDRARAAVAACGLPFALSTSQGLAGPGDDLLALPRVCIGSDLSLPRFRLLVAGGR